MYGLTLLAAIAHLHLDHRPPLRQPRRRLGPHLPLRRLGRRRRHRRRAALPPRDELERGARPVVGAVRDLEGRPRRLGRDRGGLHRRRHHREAGRRRRRRCSPTASRPACSSPRRWVGSGTGGTRSSSGSRRTCPGASRSTPFTGRSRTIDQATYHPAFLYEMIWNLLAAAAFLVYVVERRFHPRPPGLFALYIALYSFGRFWIELDPGRPREPHPRPPRQHLGVRARLRRRARLVLALATQPRKPGETPAPAAGPKMAVPKGRVRPGG